MGTCCVGVYKREKQQHNDPNQSFSSGGGIYETPRKSSAPRLTRQFPRFTFVFGRTSRCHDRLNNLVSPT